MLRFVPCDPEAKLTPSPSSTNIRLAITNLSIGDIAIELQDIALNPNILVEYLQQRSGGAPPDIQMAIECHHNQEGGKILGEVEDETLIDFSAPEVDMNAGNKLDSIMRELAGLTFQGPAESKFWGGW